MKGKIPVCLSAFVLLCSIAGCAHREAVTDSSFPEGSQDSSDAMASVSQTSEATSVTQTESTKTTEQQPDFTAGTEKTDATESSAQTESRTEPTVTEATVQGPTVIEPVPTQPHQDPTTAPTKPHQDPITGPSTEAPTLPPEELPTEISTVPSTEPKPTEKPAPTETAPTELQYEVIDTAALEAYGRKYAFDTYGYEGDTSMNLENSGYFPGIERLLETMKDGYTMVKNLVDAQYQNDMGMGYPVVKEIDGVLCRARLNLYFEPTDHPNIFIVYCLYG